MAFISLEVSLCIFRTKPQRRQDLELFHSGFARMAPMKGHWGHVSPFNICERALGSRLAFQHLDTSFITERSGPSASEAAKVAVLKDGPVTPRAGKALTNQWPQHTSSIGKFDSKAQSNLLARITINGARRFDRLM